MNKIWVEFDFANYQNEKPFGLVIGCGILADSLEDALLIIKEKAFSGRELPPISKTILNVDISTLDQNHVIPNMNPPVNKGIWFPIGYE